MTEREIHEEAKARAERRFPYREVNANVVIGCGVVAAMVSMLSLAFAGVDIDNPPGSVIIAVAFFSVMIAVYYWYDLHNKKNSREYAKEYARLLAQARARGDYRPE